jgi:hypothetical protein
MRSEQSPKGLFLELVQCVLVTAYSSGRAIAFPGLMPKIYNQILSCSFVFMPLSGFFVSALPNHQSDSQRV